MATNVALGIQRVDDLGVAGFGIDRLFDADVLLVRFFGPYRSTFAERRGLYSIGRDLFGAKVVEGRRVHHDAGPYRLSQDSRLHRAKFTGRCN